MRKYPRGRRGSPAKGVGGLKTRARVQIPPSAPEHLETKVSGCSFFFFGAPMSACGEARIQYEIGHGKKIFLTEAVLSVYTKYNKYMPSGAVVWYKTELQEVHP